MKTRSALAALALTVRCALALAQTAVSPAAGPADFTVGDIRVEGLQRVSEGTVYNYLPVNIGDHLSAQRAREAIRALYATGFFRDVQLRRDGSTLIVVVLERPSIESFEITGTRTSRPRICRSRCATSDSRPARPSTARCSRTLPSISPTSTSPAASTA